MRRIFLLGVMLAAALSAQPGEIRARASVKELGEKIRSLLAAELAAGGFEGAVKVCAEKAQAETKRYAAEHGIQIRRVSTKARNRANRPDDWERARLEEWAAALQAGETLPEFAESGKAEGEYRLLVPIRIQAMCLSCHGGEQQIPVAVKALLKEHYPRDAAVNYRNGDLRGAFSVTLPRP